MKRILLTAIIAIISFTVNAQKDVYFSVNHFLGSNNFALNTAATNNLGNQFKVTRMEYYIAEIQLIHDRGTVTTVDTTWILVNANEVTNKHIGNYNITNLEAVKFTVGVNNAVNHLDPTQYSMLHALSPKSPSMHWGWSAGYRFAAMEGKSGSNYSQTFEFHALGDVNYYPLTVATAGTTNGADLTIEINADYEKAIMNIDVIGGPIMHGETGTAKEVLVNFNRNVFTSVEGNNTVGIEEMAKANFNVYPNPSNQRVYISLSNIENTEVGIVVSDLIGNRILEINNITDNNVSLNINEAGIYFVTLISESGSYIRTEKLIITD